MYHSTYFLGVENFGFTWTGYGDDVIDHFRKKSLFFRDAGDSREYDAGGRLSMPGPGPEKLVAEVCSFKKKLT